VRPVHSDDQDVIAMPIGEDGVGSAWLRGVFIG
jgi:hypothetical protein